MSDRALPPRVYLYTFGSEPRRTRGSYPAQFFGESIGLDWPGASHEIVVKVSAYTHDQQFPVRQ